MARSSRKDTELHRQQVIDGAATLLRERGVAGVNVGQLMAEAGLTHGGFYRHFGSKDELVALALEKALADQRDWATGQTEQELIDFYLSPEHRDDPGHGCTMGALGSEIARADESARAAFTYATNNAAALGIPKDRLGAIEAHIHVPAGAIPKDGPSAGIAIATALVSEMSDRPVRGDVAMTGEITLRGRVLPIGGLKEKVLGAHRAGIKTIIIPKANEADIEDVPEEVRNVLSFHPVETLSEVLEIALVPGEEKPAPLEIAGAA